MDLDTFARDVDGADDADVQFREAQKRIFTSSPVMWTESMKRT